MIVQYDELREYLGEETRWVAIGADAGSNPGVGGARWGLCRPG